MFTSWWTRRVDGSIAATNFFGFGGTDTGLIVSKTAETE